MSLLKQRKIKAPDWFVDLWDRSIQAANEASELLGVSPQWFKMANPAGVTEQFNKMPRGDRQKYNLTMTYHLNCRNMAWALLRYQNMNQDTEIANAEYMNYNEATHEITIRNGMMAEFVTKTQDTFNKIFNKSNDVFRKN